MARAACASSSRPPLARARDLRRRRQSHAPPRQLASGDHRPNSARAQFVHGHLRRARRRRIILFDAGVDRAGAALDRLLGALDADRDDVREVFLTHGHFDHVAASPLCAQAKIRVGAPDVVIPAANHRSIAALADALAGVGVQTVCTGHMGCTPPGRGGAMLAALVERARRGSEGVATVGRSLSLSESTSAASAAWTSCWPRAWRRRSPAARRPSRLRVGDLRLASHRSARRRRRRHRRRRTSFIADGFHRLPGACTASARSPSPGRPSARR